jgi:Na+/melibiose symporter-like transporter
MPISPGRFRALYGARLPHLLVLTGCFLLAGYALSALGPDRLFGEDVWWQSITVWFMGAAIVVDFVLLPLCATANRALTAVLGHRRTSPHPAPRVPLVNYIRVPVLASGLLLVLFLPGIIEQGARTHLAATGHTHAPFLERWLWLTLLFCCLSVLAYAVRSCALRRRNTPSTEGERDD